MWLMTTQGFYSAVEHREDPEKMIVRCRVHGDLAALRTQIPGLKMFYDDLADYPWRAIVSRSEWALAVARLAQEVNYDNFKHAVEVRQGRRRSNAYMEVWYALLKLEVKGYWRRINAARARHDWMFDLEELPMEPAAAPCGDGKGKGKGRRSRGRRTKGARS